MLLGLELFFCLVVGFFVCLFVCLWLCWVSIAVHRLSLVAISGDYSLVALYRLLIVVASLTEQHRL